MRRQRFAAGRRRTPLTPIFNAATRRGGVDVGNTPGASPTCALNMTLVGSIVDATKLDGQDAKMIRNGNLMYVFGNNGWFNVIDVTDYANPTIVGSTQDSIHLSDPRFGVTYDAGYVYVGDGDNGWFNVIDVTTPTAPSVVASIAHANSSAILSELVKVGDYVFGVDWGAGAIFSVDVSTPASPSFVDFHTDVGYFPSDEFELVVDGGYLYATSYWDDQVLIYNISNPAAISLTGVTTSAFFDAPYAGLAKSGSYVYGVGDGSNSAIVVDVSNPAAPTVVGSVVDSTNLNGPEVGVWKEGNYLYAIAYGSDSLAVIDVTNPASPSVVGSYVSPAFPNQTFDGPFSVVRKVDNYVFAVAYWGGGDDNGALGAFDVTDPSSPQFNSFSDTLLKGPSPYFVVDDNHAFLRGGPLRDSFLVVSLFDC